MAIIVVPAAPVVAPVTAVSSDGFLTVTVDTVNGGVLLEANFSSLVPPPRKVRFVRGDDDTVVRSGDEVWSPGGYAVAYDLEMPLGAVTSWRAIPIFGTAGVYTEGAPSSSAAVIPPDVDTDRDFWVKPTSSPALSLRLRSNIPDPEFGRSGRDSLVEIQGADVLSGSWDVMVRQSVTYTFLTATAAERDALVAVVGAGPVLIQCLSLYGIADGYWLASGLAETYHVGAYDPRRKIDVTFSPVNRPPTTGAPLYIPGRSYADVDAAYLSYAQLAAAKPSYRSILAP